jgi:hypothetical protein
MGNRLQSRTLSVHLQSFLPTKSSSKAAPLYIANWTVQQPGRASVLFCADTIGKPKTAMNPDNFEGHVTLGQFLLTLDNPGHPG